MRKTWILGAVAFAWAISAHAAATWTFSNCGAAGPTGPSQGACDAAYGGNPVVSVAGGVQTWTVPATGTYRITATGAQGASAEQPTYVGGRGARIAGEFTLTSGQTLKLVVGQRGNVEEGEGTTNGGGGGGSFVVSAANVPMLVAGGGGGTREEAEQNGCDASITQFAIIGSESDATSPCTPKTAGVGLGGVASSGSWGSAGGGFNGDGGSDCEGQGGRGWANGMLGGDLTGGFGGGGDGAGCDGGGGGGGYSGGDGGLIAGGGGSYNTGANPSAAGGVGTGDGSIVIEQLTAPVATTVPTLSEWSLIILSALLALGTVVALRRRSS